MASRLQEKVAVVTGAGGLVGQATVRRLAEEGAAVVAADLRRDAAEEAAGLARKASGSGEARAMEVDVSDERSMSSLVTSVLDRYGRLDLFHNNAALITTEAPDGDLVELDVEVWDAKMAVNARGVMLGCKHAARAMLSVGQGGAIVNMASVSGLVGVDVHPAYGASKAAVIGLTRYVATMYGSASIRCNAVAPGLIVGTGSPARMTDRQLAEYRAERLLPWAASPEDIAAVVAFLASDDGRCITGQTIVVDCGTTAHRPRHAMMAWEQALSELGGKG